MRRLILSRLAQMMITLLAVVTMTFVLFRLMPGDPTAALIDPTFPPEAVQRLREAFGIDKPIHEQYFIYIKNLLKGELGMSFFYRVPVSQIILEKFYNSLTLMLASFFLAYGTGIVLEVLMAWKRKTKLEGVAMILSLFFRCVPVFWLGMVAIIIFSYRLGWFPYAGMRSMGYTASGLFEKFFSLDFLRHLILPTVVSALYYQALPLLLMRNTMLEVMEEDFVEFARAKGLKETEVMFKHVARNALLPVVTSAAVFFGIGVSTMALIEYVFSWPGLGREIVKAVSTYDYPLEQGVFIMLSIVVLVMNLVADVLYGYLDPRIVYKGMDG